MKLLIAVVKDGYTTFYGPPDIKGKQAKLDAEAQFLELKLLTNNPQNKENLEWWRSWVKEKNYYGLLVSVDHDKNSMEFCPLKTSKEYNDFLEESASGVSESKK